MNPVEASAERVGQFAKARRWNIACAESLTSGAVASALGAATESSEWFRGGIVAFSSVVKYDLLGVGRGPVVSARCAQQMARAATRLFSADAAVATTGAGGPDAQDGQPAGTVFIAVTAPGIDIVTEHHFDGDPATVVETTVARSLQLLAEQLA